MSWSALFTARARALDKEPVYLLDSLIPDDWPGAEVHLSSHSRSGYRQALIPSRCMIMWGGTSPPSWQMSASSARIAVIPGTSFAGVRRGTILRLSIALGTVVEPVWVGALTNIRYGRAADEITLELVGLEGALWGKYATSTADLDPPFVTGVAGNPAASWTIGTANLDLEGVETAQEGRSGWRVVRLGPAGSSATYVGGTGWSAGGGTGGSDRLSGVSSSGFLDSSPTSASISTGVVAVAYDEGHPLQMVSDCLTPAEASGWPSRWRIGWPAGCMDHLDVAAEIDRHAASGILSTFFAAHKLVVDGAPVTFGDALYPLASDSGCLIVQRHGLVSGRVVHNSLTLGDLEPPTVRDSDLVDATWSWWADHATCYKYTVYDRSGRPAVPLYSSDALTTYAVTANIMRAMGKRAPDLPPSGVYGAAAGASSFFQLGSSIENPWTYEYQSKVPAFGSSRSAWREDVRQRLYQYVMGRPEVATIVLAGWWDRCVGEGIRLDLSAMTSRAAAEAGVYTGSVGIIIGGGPDFFGNTTTYTVLTVAEQFDVDEPVGGVAPVITLLELGVAEVYVLVGAEVTSTVEYTGTEPVTVEYQWTRNSSAISGATADSYTTAAGDAGTAVRLSVTATNDYGVDIEVSTAIYPGYAPAITSVTLPSSDTVGDDLTATVTTTGTAPITLSYQWKAGGEDIDGETSATYANDGAYCFGFDKTSTTAMGIQTTTNLSSMPTVGTLLAVVDIHAAGSGHQPILDVGADGGTVSLGLILSTSASGPMRVQWWDGGGTPRTLDTSASAPAGRFLVCFTWTGSACELSMWQDGEEVGTTATAAYSGPTSASGPIVMHGGASACELGWAILDTVVTDPSVVDETHPAGPWRAAVALSAPWAGVRALAAEGVDVTPAGSSGGLSLPIQVLGLGATPEPWETEAGVTSAMTTTGAAGLAGDTITVAVTADSSWGSDGPETSNTCTLAFTGFAANATAATQTGGALPLVGATLTVDTVTIAAGTLPIRYAYQWYRDSDPIPGETGTSYTTTGDDEDLPINYGVTVRNLYGTDTVVYSDGSTPGYAADVTAVALDDYTVVVGAVVTATPTTTGSGVITVAYRWRLDGALISGATSSTYTTTAPGDLVCEAQATNDWGVSDWVASTVATVTAGAVYGIQRAHQTTSDTIASVDNAPALPSSTWTWLAYLDFSAYATSGSSVFAWNVGATSNQFGLNMVTTTTPDRARGLYRDTGGASRTFDVNYPAGVGITTYGPHILSISRGSTGVVTLRIVKGGTVVASGNGGGTNTFGNGSAAGVIAALTNMAGVMAWAIGSEALDAAAHSGLTDAPSTPRDFFNGRGTLWAGWQVNAADEATIDPAADVVSIGAGLTTAWAAVGSSGGLSAEEG